MLRKMPGDEWQQFANLRLVYSYMFTHPGAKLMFMGSEFGQGTEWNYQHSLPWHVLEYPNHQGIKEAVKALNALYKSEPALYERQFSGDGFEWIDGGNAADSIMIFLRKGDDAANDLVVVLNMTPVTRHDFRVGVPYAGNWKEIFTSDAHNFWGSDVKNTIALKSEGVSWHGRENSIKITVPPLAATVFKKIK
jgi:1,4-alpha-glucan branching enzyme